MFYLKYTFNRSLLTEMSRDTADAVNIVFWGKLQELAESNPHAIINVTVRLKERYGRLVEMLEFDCGTTEIQNHVQALYDLDYKAFPLELLPGVDKKDVLQDL